MELQEIIQKFVNFGYEIKYKDNNRYIELVKMFNNSDINISGGEEIQIGRFIEIYDNKIISKSYMKRGYLWSGSAYTQKNKGNVYAIGNEKIIAKF